MRRGRRGRGGGGRRGRGEGVVGGGRGQHPHSDVVTLTPRARGQVSNHFMVVPLLVSPRFCSQDLQPTTHESEKLRPSSATEKTSMHNKQNGHFMLQNIKSS